MRALDDHELLAQAAAEESGPAFAALVERYVNLVYSTALRFTDNAQHAEEITQAVFIILARKAGSLRHGTVLSGWLYQTARLTAANFVRGEVRRHRREQEAYMRSTLNTAEPASWEEIAPLLDEAMGQLGEADRNAVVLRYFENKTAAETAAALKLTEAAAQKRTQRAVDKLRKIFSKRGITSAAAIAAVISANSVQAAPSGLAVKAAGMAAKGAGISAMLTTLVKGTMKTMTWIKYKFAAGMGVAVLVAGGAATVAVSQSGEGGMTAQKIIEKSRGAYAALSSYSDSGTVVFDIGGEKVITTFNIRLQRPNQYRIDWTQTSGVGTTKGEIWSDGTTNHALMLEPASGSLPGQAPKLKTMPSLQAALAQAGPVSGTAATSIPGAFFDQDVGDLFIDPVLAGNRKIQKEPDAKVGDVDCYVVSSETDLSKAPDGGGKPGTATSTLWIGKKDLLIHQCRTKYVERVGQDLASNDQAIDDAIRKSLEMQNKPVTPEAIAAMRPQMRSLMKQVQATVKAGFESGVVYTQMHDHISVNQQISPADFAQ